MQIRWCVWRIKGAELMPVTRASEARAGWCLCGKIAAHYLLPRSRISIKGKALDEVSLKFLALTSIRMTSFNQEDDDSKDRLRPAHWGILSCLLRIVDSSSEMAMLADWPLPLFLTLVLPDVECRLCTSSLQWRSLAVIHFFTTVLRLLH